MSFSLGLVLLLGHLDVLLHLLRLHNGGRVELREVRGLQLEAHHLLAVGCSGPKNYPKGYSETL